MSHKVWIYIGFSIPLYSYLPMLFELHALAPAIAAYDSLNQHDRLSLNHEIALLSSSVYGMHLILLFCIGISLKSAKSSPIWVAYLHLGLFSMFCLIYMALWTEMNWLIPGTYSIYDIAGFILIGGCVYALRVDVRRVREIAP